MKTKALLAALVGGALIFATLPAEAGGYRHGGHGYYGGYKHYGGYKYRGHRHRHGGYGDEILIGAGIIGGAVLLGHLLAPRPYYYQPAPTYTAPRRVDCYRDQVYRTLPDGRIQTGTRTRCY